MGHLRFWRRVKIAPGLTLNVSKSGPSLSLGPRGAKYTVGPRGRRTTVGLPGTGLHYTSTSSGSGKRTRKGRGARPSPVASPENRLTLGFFKRLVTPKGEEAFVDGCRELARGSDKAALDHFERGLHLPDAAFMAGFLHLKRKETGDAAPLLDRAVREHRRLGRLFSKYGLTLTFHLPITEEFAAHVGPTLRGALLAQTECFQLAGEWEKAYDCLLHLRKLEPRDPAILLSLIELVWQANSGNEETCRYIVGLTKAVKNETPVHSALLLYKARALIGLDMRSAALDTLTPALRRRKDRAPELMRALRYERAGVYEAMGQVGRARADYERLYAEDPDYRDVARKLTG